MCAQFGHKIITWPLTAGVPRANHNECVDFGQMANAHGRLLSPIPMPLLLLLVLAFHGQGVESVPCTTGTALFGWCGTDNAHFDARLNEVAERELAVCQQNCIQRKFPSNSNSIIVIRCALHRKVPKKCLHIYLSRNIPTDDKIVTNDICIQVEPMKFT